VNPVQLVNVATRAWRVASARTRADHSTLDLRQVRFAPQSMTRYYLYAATAPSRRTAREWDDDQVARAQQFARSFITDAWVDAPETADQEVTIFRERAPDGSADRALYVHRNGLVELLWALGCELDDEGRRELDVTELAHVTVAFAVAVAGREYRNVCRTTRRPLSARRTDWLLQVSTAVSTSEGQHLWDALHFPGEAPSRAMGSRASAPLNGYGSGALRSLRRRKAPARVPATLLKEFMATNGYYGAAGLADRLAAEANRDHSQVAIRGVARDRR
jgi:hypothetical protein